MKTFTILGAGKLSAIIAESYRAGLLEGYTLTGIFSRKKEDAERLAAGTGAIACDDMEEIFALKPDFAAECASIALLKEVCVRLLENGTSVIPLSIGAFADEDFHKKAVEAAIRGGSKIHIPSGAVGGFDVLSTISLMAAYGKTELKAGIHTHKGPLSLKNTPLYSDELMESEKTVFEGTTKEAIALLPTKVNVAVASALATAGPGSTGAAITSVPGFIGDDHMITAETAGLKATVDIYSATSDIAAWSVVALMRNLNSPIVFF